MSKAVPYANSRTMLAKKKRKVFLRVLAQTGKVVEAAKACGFVDTSTIQRYRREDEDFAKDWDVALQAAANVLEEEAIRRATEGVLEPVFYKGDVVGYKTNYSDSLLMFVLRGLKPDTYRESARGGETNINFGIAVLPMTAKDDDQWEQRAQVMHSEQKTITIDAKPVENAMTRVQRGD